VKGGRKEKKTPGSNEGKDEAERMERNMPGAKDEQEKTRRREGKEICLGQKTSRERRGGEKGKKYAWCKRIA
jgi:hypothetical protein